MPRSGGRLPFLQRKVRGRVRLTNSDRLFFVLLYRWFPSILKTVTVIKPETLVRWHRAGFRRCRSVFCCGASLAVQSAPS
jgi:hypothetical protein